MPTPYRSGIRGLLVVALGVSLGWPREGRVSQVAFQDVSFEEVLRAPIIARVRPVDPPSSTRPVRVDGAPDFQRFIEHFEVVEVIRQPSVPSATRVARPTLAPGDRVDVHSADLRTEIEGHRMYHVTGEGESPIYARFPSGQTIPATAERIAFLAFDPWENLPEFQWMVLGAQVPVSEADRVRREVTQPSAQPRTAAPVAAPPAAAPPRKPRSAGCTP